MAIRDSIVGAIQQAAMVEQLLNRWRCCVQESGSGAILLEDLKYSKRKRRQYRKTYKCFKDMFNFDKSRFQENRAQQRESDKESYSASGAGGGGYKDEINWWFR